MRLLQRLAGQVAPQPQSQPTLAIIGPKPAGECEEGLLCSAAVVPFYRFCPPGDAFAYLQCTQHLLERRSLASWQLPTP
jgi:hypothetical protein